MTLDEQIEKINQNLGHFAETNQWLAAANALNTIEKLIKVKAYLGPELSSGAAKTLVENWGKINCKPEQTTE